MSIRTMRAKRLPIQHHDTAIVSWQLGRLAPFVLIVAVSARGLGLIDLTTLRVAVGCAAILALAAFANSAVAFVRIWWEGGTGARFAVRGVAFGLLTLAPMIAVATFMARVPAPTFVTTSPAAPPSLEGLGRDMTLPTDMHGQIDSTFEDVVSRRFATDPAVIDRAARTAADRLGWIVEAQSQPGMVDDATWFRARARLPLVGLNSDIAVRVLPDRYGAIMDISAISTGGAYDFGLTLRRVRALRNEIDRVLVEAYGITDNADASEGVDGLHDTALELPPAGPAPRSTEIPTVPPGPKPGRLPALPPDGGVGGVAPEELEMFRTPSAGTDGGF